MRRLPTPTPALHSLIALLALGLSQQACTPKDQEAKERLFSPPPPDPVLAQAKEEIPVFELATNEAAWARVNRMGYDEMKARLSSFTYTSEGNLNFNRVKLEINSTEKIRVVQSKSADFSISLLTGDGSTQEVVFANDVLFLKNNNGKWRASRDPKGERGALVDDTAGVWRSFFDLFKHKMTVKKIDGLKKHAGREVVAYAMSVDDDSEKAAALGREKTELPTTHPVLGQDAGSEGDEASTVDGGDGSADDKASREVMDRLGNWRKAARPAGGKGEMLVDTKTGVILKLSFDGAMVVGDAPSPARLEVVVKVAMNDVGADLDVTVPKEAIEEIARKKWPTNPRADIEKAGIVPPLPKEDPATAPPSDAQKGEKKASEDDAAP